MRGPLSELSCRCSPKADRTALRFCRRSYPWGWRYKGMECKDLPWVVVGNALPRAVRENKESRKERISPSTAQRKSGAV